MTHYATFGDLRDAQRAIQPPAPGGIAPPEDENDQALAGMLGFCILVSLGLWGAFFYWLL